MEQLNNLASEQEQLGNQIQGILTNAKKDPSVRKTDNYIQSRLKKVEDVWNQIQENHKKMTAVKMEHNYFTQKYFEQLKQLYEDTKNYLEKCKKPERSEGTGDNPDQAAKLKKQEFKIDQMQKEIEKVQRELQHDQQKWKYEVLLKRLTEYWKAIYDLNEDITLNEKTFEDEYFANEAYARIETEFDAVVDRLQTKIFNLPKESSRPNIPLPQVTLPIFNGKYEDWPAFHDIFLRLVHNNPSLSKIEKIQYLKTHIKGEPNKMTQHLKITEANYDAVWSLLKKRYDNTRLIFGKLVDRILDLPVAQHGSAEELKRLHDTTTECLEGIKSLGVETETWGPLISRIISRKWDPETNKVYQQTIKNPHELQDFQEMMNFLQTRFQSLEESFEDKKKSNVNWTTRPAYREQNCKYCEESHSIHTCNKFKTLPIEKRIEWVKEKKVCYNCLSHSSNETCSSKLNCRSCNKKHHTLLHKEYQKRQPQSTTTSEQRATTSNNVSTQNQNALIATALVQVETLNGTNELLRALIDPGSQASFITEHAAQIIGKPRMKVHAEVNGVGDAMPKVAKWKINAQITSRFSSNYRMNVECLVLPKLTQQMPQQQLDADTEEWKNCLLADPTYHTPGPIHMILGVEEYAQIVLPGMQKAISGLLGQNTQLGWILSGNMKTKPSETIQLISMVTQIEEDKQLKRFWEIEEVETIRHLSGDEERCEEIYKQTTKRNDDGTYTVRIPFKTEKQELGDSKSRATARLLQTEKRLGKDKHLREDYHKFMEEYLKLGHMRKATKNNNGSYYIPHHAVIRESSSTTKLRVVFDASCKPSQGKSLNELMYTGPKLQQELPDLLLRWRTYKIAFTADIEKMYRQIKLHEQDQKFHHILWRWDEKKPIEEYELTTVTYGTAAAPYLAIRTLHQLAEDEAGNYPCAAEIVRKDFYVDDVLSGAKSVKEAQSLQEELINLLKSGGFTLRKWRSNNNEVLNNLPAELLDVAALQNSDNETKKSLGVHWAPTNDIFKFKVDLSETKKVTKRHILSEVAKIFDPLGWLAPVVISAKLLIQQLWLADIPWDHEVSEEFRNKWYSFQQQSKSMEEITIPRWIAYIPAETDLELHGFCDASERAYGAVIYARTTNYCSGDNNIELLTAKSKVAPARTKITLPRLELCAAVLLSKLLNRTQKSLNIDVRMYAWTDSMVTISWIKGDASRWKTFVANRVSDIQKLVSAEIWNHVKSEDNPADAISRGMDPSTLKRHTLWWHGPSWLQDPSKWPTAPVPTETVEELKNSQLNCFQTTAQGKEEEIFNRFSDFTKAIRVLSYCNRFIRKCQKKETANSTLTPEEMECTLLQIIRKIQLSYFKKEIHQLNQGKQVDKNSKISNLSPFLDQNNIMRVGGRLQDAVLPYNGKHPIILPNREPFIKCLIDNAHQTTLHGGIQATLAYLRRKFWITTAKKSVSSFIKKCVKCIRYKAQTAQQMMGNLPAARITPSPPFCHTGIDFAGPMLIRTTKGRGNKSYKGYICIFICMSTKAIHLEVVSDLSTNTFLAAFRRFTARRGNCSHIYSDNGSNFVGASKIIEKEMHSVVSKNEVQDKLASTGTNWHFIPPASPHFGGLWEAGVKSMKHHLKRVIGESTLTFEEMSTLMCQIEACLNSRPLVPLTEDANDNQALTPGHFLIGRELVAPPDPISTHINPSVSNRWKLIQKMKRDFWRAWSSEYLSKLQQRYKWKTHSDNLQIGDLVIIKEEIHPSRWPLARVSDVHPGPDGAVRVVTVKKAGGITLKRAITNVIPLPKEEEKNHQEDSAPPARYDVNLVQQATTHRVRHNGVETDTPPLHDLQHSVSNDCCPRDSHSVGDRFMDQDVPKTSQSLPQGRCCSSRARND